MKYEYRTIDTSTLKGLKLAEKLHMVGWKTDRIGLFMIWFSRKVA